MRICRGPCASVWLTWAALRLRYLSRRRSGVRIPSGLQTASLLIVTAFAFRPGRFSAVERVSIEVAMSRRPIPRRRHTQK